MCYRNDRNNNDVRGDYDNYDNDVRGSNENNNSRVRVHAYIDGDDFCRAVRRCRRNDQVEDIEDNNSHNRCRCKCRCRSCRGNRF